MNVIDFNNRPPYTTIFVATHNTTNLKYLAKTTKHHTHEELEKKYHGSGIRWKNHLNKHGDDVSIEIIGTFETSEVKKYAIAISFAYDVVNSDEWANLMIEDGLSGGNAFVGKTKNEMNEIKQKMSDSHLGVSRTEQTKINISNAQKGENGYWYGKKQSVERIEKISGANNFMYGKHHTNEAKEKVSKSWKNKPQIQCPYCEMSSKQPSCMKRWHFDNCKHKPK